MIVTIRVTCVAIVTIIVHIGFGINSFCIQSYKVYAVGLKNA